MSNAEKVVVPQFFIAGAPKCGTTSLHAILGSHPSVDFGRLKEPSSVDFFDEFCELGRVPADYDGSVAMADEAVLSDWSNQYADSPHAAVLGDATPRYIFMKRAARRIARLNPDARMIFILRQPSKRLWSVYRQDVAQGRETQSFHSSLRRGLLRIKMRCGYRDGLESYYEVFDPEQILVCSMEEWIATPDLVHQRMLRHIGVDDSVRLESQTLNVGGERVVRPRVRAAGNALRNLRAESASGDDRVLIGKLSNKLTNRAMAVARALAAPRFGEEPRSPRMPEGVREDLDVHFERYEHGLSELTGYDFARWWGMNI